MKAAHTQNPGRCANVHTVMPAMTAAESAPARQAEQTLGRHAKRYVFNASGVAGLRNELAGFGSVR